MRDHNSNGVSVKHQSAKRRQKMDEVRGPREEFRLEYQFCWFCGIGCVPDCHEMAKGNSHRDAALSERCTWAGACPVCNCGCLNDYSVWPVERQLALKWVHDRNYFDLDAFNKLRGRGPRAITMAQIIPWICRELD